MMLRSRRCALVAGVAFLLFSGFAGSVVAHAELQASSPFSGARLEESPEVVWLRFTEAVEPSLTQIVLLDAALEPRAVSPFETKDDGHRVVVPLEESLPPGGYLIGWETVSAVDGHRTHGTIPFVIGDNATLLETQDPTMDPLRIDAVAGKTLLFGGLAGLIGTFGFWFLCVPRASRVHLAGLVERTGLTSLAIHLTGGLLLSVSQAASLGLPLSAYLFETAFGRNLAARLGLTLLMGSLWILLRQTTKDPASTPRWVHLWPLVGIITLLYGASSHMAGSLDAAWIGTLIDAAHLASMGVWLGGLVLLVGVLSRLQNGSQAFSPHHGELIRRFSWTAFWMVIVVVATGLLMTGALIGFDPQSWSMITYGRLLAIKAALALVMIGLGGWNKLVHVAQATQQGLQAVTIKGFRSNVRREIFTAALILVIAGAMTNLAPPLAHLEHQETEATHMDHHEHPHEGHHVGPILELNATTSNYQWRVTLAPTPQAGEEIHYTITLFDPTTQSRERDARSITIHTTYLNDTELGDSRIDAKVTEQGTYETTASNFPFPGEYRLTFTVDTRIAYQEQFTHELSVQ